MNISTATAREIARDCVRLGMKHVVVCPGSRSASLTYAFAELDRQGIITAHVRIDERSAGFLALGIAKGLRAQQVPGPVGVVTTSGTAVLNLGPAIAEAAYSHVPIVALTADRPARLRATGANQTLDDQSRALPEVLAAYDVPAGEPAPVADALSVAMGETGLPGPVQLNVQFDVPLVPEATDFPWDVPVESARAFRVHPGEQDIQALADALDALKKPGTVAVVGDCSGFDVPHGVVRGMLAGVPVFAEPTSALIDMSVPVPHRVLDARGWEDVTTVVQYGKATLFRPTAKLLAQRPVLTIPLNVEWWPEEAIERSRALSAEPGEGLDSREPRVEFAGNWPAELSVAESIVSTIAAGSSHMLVGSSNAVRYLANVPPTGCYIHASRGLAGIDGLISTGIGIAKAGQNKRPQRGDPLAIVIGDVTALHDIGGLLLETGENLPPVQIFILNDDGGSIFAGLEHGQDHLAPYFDRFFATRHGRNFDHLATGYGWPYRYINTMSDLQVAVDGKQPGVYEVVFTPDQ
ncbi:2-succinyl-5-enolpyruvyl-6-hydroxy-3-cyclohexene-1-carboxylate synthase [Brevibacterium paucivorans]|uniref:2-succinyl-5-enolpyruvyl-6-hydroxy-3-cyclohexene-1-carboxylate synthase n=1 Tax=Brevibacterium paucivorans TaxID=170994 RepID=A0ABS2SKL9_9MICO|nr:2-succinyl-5-enolpyruvyl-6-hydroxy-3-cyclohexene-1-carboxylate synthase [Brevibacterium paucivorans]